MSNNWNLDQQRAFLSSKPSRQPLMSEYWVSKKKYFCKYCEIFIADDAPSRQHHENGFRHKGNVERYIRGIYKAGEKKKKDEEEEKREMIRVEQAAQAAFAQDVSLGHAKASSAPVASTSSGPRKPATKPSSVFANYSTAAQLGFTDPDAERLELRNSQGLVGDWQLVASTAAPPSAEAKEGSESEAHAGADVTTTGTTESSVKRPAETIPEDDTRAFKLRKKTMAVGLGEKYDPGLIPIKLKKKEEKPAHDESILKPNSSSSTSTGEALKWTSISLKAKDSTISPPIPSDTSSRLKSEETNNSLSNSDKSSSTTSRWAKVQWSQPVKEEDPPATLSVTPPSTLAEPEIKTEDNVAPATKMEPLSSSLPYEPEPELSPPTAALFKKRKAPAGAGRGRRQM